MSDDDWTAGTDALLLTECRRCARRWYLPHDRCPHCGSPEHRRPASSGTGSVVAVTVMHTGSDDTDVPSRICLVDLDDGLRAMGRAAEDVQVGDRVRVTWDRHQPVFVAYAVDD